MRGANLRFDRNAEFGDIGIARAHCTLQHSLGGRFEMAAAFFTSSVSRVQ